MNCDGRARTEPCDRDRHDGGRVIPATRHERDIDERGDL
jgi:hypothetical protein